MKIFLSFYIGYRLIVLHKKRNFLATVISIDFSEKKNLIGI